MALAKVLQRNVKQDPRGITYWFAREDKNLLIVFDANGIIFFEYISTACLIEGGRFIALRAGTIGGSKKNLSPISRSRVVTYDNSVSPQLQEELIAEIRESEEIDSYLRGALCDFLLKKEQTLFFTVPIHDFDKIFGRSVLKRTVANFYIHFSFLRFRNGRLISIFSAGTVLLLIILSLYTIFRSTPRLASEKSESQSESKSEFEAMFQTPAMIEFKSQYKSQFHSEADCEKTVKMYLTDSSALHPKDLHYAVMQLLFYCEKNADSESCRLLHNPKIAEELKRE